jgi:hypothetical protein
MHSNQRNSRNISASKSLWIIPSALTVLLIAIVAPNLLPTRENKHYASCINNLRLIDSAKKQWALENNKTNFEVPTWTDLSSYLGRGRGYIPKCPLSGTYTLGPVNSQPTCSFSNHFLP